MDYYTVALDNQNETLIHEKTVSAFGLSLQGASHLQQTPAVPCQDYHDIRWLKDQGVLIAAIADGVGSCALSHWGARTAVSEALNSVEQTLAAIAGRNSLHLSAGNRSCCEQMKQVMLKSFHAAQSAVEKLADQSTAPMQTFPFQSTLTLAIYDGDCLFHGHVGDDGIVAQLPDGTVKMATLRTKGEEANSVVPLQGGEDSWIFGVVPHVSGFIMATDGVLDSFVATQLSPQGDDYFGGICYSFMENAIYNLAAPSPDAPQKTRNEYKQFLLSDYYRNQVIDDLTLVAVVSPQAVHAGIHPAFSMELWKKAAEDKHKSQQKALYENQATFQNHQQPKPNTGHGRIQEAEPTEPYGFQYSPPSQPKKKAPAPPHPKVSPEPVQPKRKHSSVVNTVKSGLMVVFFLIIFTSGIFLGRSIFAPVMQSEFEELKQAYAILQEKNAAAESLLADENNSLKAKLEDLQTQLSEKEHQILNLIKDNQTLADQISILESSLSKMEKTQNSQETTP